MVEVSVSRKAGLPLFTECSISVDADEGLDEDGWWGGALAVFGFLGPETEANAVRMEPTWVLAGLGCFCCLWWFWG